MGRQLDDDAAVDVGPFRMVIHLLDHRGRCGHKSKCEREVSEPVIAVQLLTDVAPSWEVRQCSLNVGLSELDGQLPV